MICLCGHFDPPCEYCKPKVDDPAALRKMTAKDWSRSCSVEMPRPDSDCVRRRILMRTVSRQVAAYWDKRLQELVLEDLKKEFGDEAVSESTQKNPRRG